MISASAEAFTSLRPSIAVLKALRTLSTFLVAGTRFELVSKAYETFEVTISPTRNMLIRPDLNRNFQIQNLM